MRRQIYVIHTADFADTSKSNSKQGLVFIRILLYREFGDGIEGFNVNTNTMLNIRDVKENSVWFGYYFVKYYNFVF
jgi:hypothetical protein